MNNSIELLRDMVTGEINNPGKGAVRAMSIIASLNCNNDIPMDKIKTIDILWKKELDAVFPVIRLEFHGTDEVIKKTDKG